MIEAVFVFGILIAAFEFVVLSMVAPRYRLRLLGSRPLRTTMHFTMLIVNLYVHWGTVTGTMAATAAFVVSIFTLGLARLVFGAIAQDTYKRGLVKYQTQELVL